jgi:Tfp pilus assembly protein PilN
MNVILSAGPFLRWDQILNEIRTAIPKTARITNLFGDENSRLLLKGQALSYESIHLFADMLNNSKHVESASLIGTEKDGELSNLVMYSISCSLIE